MANFQANRKFANVFTNESLKFITERKIKMRLSLESSNSTVVACGFADYTVVLGEEYWRVA